IRPDSVLGLHVPGKFDRILEITDCQLMSQQSGVILNYIRDFANNSPAAAWHLHAHTGFWRHVMFREGKVSGQLMVNLVTSVLEEYYPLVRQLADELVREFPQITAIVHNVNRRNAQVAIGEEEMVVYGRDHIEEQLGDFRFTISANSFFQTNTVQALKLYELVADFAEFSGNELVYDLYCGTGTIGIFVSPRVRQVIGFELVEAAIKDARKNAVLNNVENVDFFLGDMKNVLIQQTELENALPKPDILITDPPRAGMHEKVVRQILKLAPEKIVYVSCNPATFARDVQLLCEEKYELVKVRPVDLFPHTAHVETVGLLKLRAAKSE
ncbi:23S rRNA (uracil(1939)-C(5))-methyltransferase RlmD, partial [bacterium]|nr:23S rRNA (uracil(1939)-C(5))-methyltransferase RlmD [bacterium]